MVIIWQALWVGIVLCAPSLPGKSFTQPYPTQIDGCLGFEIPSGIIFTDKSLEIYVTVNINTEPDQIGFVPKGCTSDQAKQKVAGCSLLGDHTPSGEMLDAYLHNQSSPSSYQACFFNAHRIATTSVIKFSWTWQVQAK